MRRAAWLSLVLAGCSGVPPEPPAAEPVAVPTVEDPPPARPDGPAPVAAEPPPEPPAVTEPPPPAVEPLPRLPPLPADGDLVASGLRVARSDSIRLITDAPAGEAARLPAFADAAAVALLEAFGPVPDLVRSPDSPPWTGLAINAEERFSRAGLLSGPLPTRLHGKHLGWRFWMRWPPREYFRRHLLAHEMTHCWTMAAGGRAPEAFLEGIAEWLATHRLAGGAAAFGVVPRSPQEARGWGRIELFRETHADRPLTAAEVMAIPPERFSGRPTAYARAWAVVALMDRWPPTHERFRGLGRRLTAGENVRDDVATLAAELDAAGVWRWWAECLDYGVDPRVCGPTEAAREGEAVLVAARAGWQATGLRVPPGGVRLKASGEVALGRGGRPWLSRPGGIRLDYAGGVPVGTLMAAVRDGAGWGEPVAVGEAGVVTGEGELHLRVNDNWADVADNAGAYRVVLE